MMEFKYKLLFVYFSVTFTKSENSKYGVKMQFQKPVGLVLLLIEKSGKDRST